MEHGVTNIPNILLQNFLSQVRIGNPDNSRPIKRIIMYLEVPAFAPHVIEHTLNLTERQSSAIEVTYYEIFVQLSSFFKD